jgi:non-canonical purine NTP pyrophosphatase (RdgB/HAM1 family)
MPQPLIILASGNRHKLSEFQKILGSMGIPLQGLSEDLNLPSPAEEGQTFLENARQKALYYGRHVDSLVLADDSGLCVDALQGAPGIYSARYSGKHGDYDANNKKLLSEMIGVNNRTARFRCAVALSSPAGRAQIVEGTCEGVIVEDERGDKGFGYDPLFLPDGHDYTFGQMESDQKNRISHRAVALIAAWEAWFTEEPYGF